MNKNKTVYIIGAGCSYEDGIPLVDNFFIKMENLINDQLKKDSTITLFKKIIALKKKNFADFNIEEFFSIIDFYISLGVEINGETLKDIRNGLLKLISLTIKHSLTNQHNSQNYSKFHHEGITGDSVIISLNWDILLDNTRTYSNYGTQFKKYDLNTKEVTGTAGCATDGKEIPLLKLHGSLNFIYCDYCKEKFLSYKQEALQVLCENIKCPTCKQGNLKLLIIPPTAFKNINGFNQLSDIWKAAYQAIKECKRIRFIGYSLPTTDVDFKQLLKASLNSRTDQPEIEVFNYKNKSMARKEFENHYNQIFDEITSLEKPIQFHYTKFSNFVKYK